MLPRRPADYWRASKMDGDDVVGLMKFATVAGLWLVFIGALLWIMFQAWGR